MQPKLIKEYELLWKNLHLYCRNSNCIYKIVYLYNFILARNEYPSVKLFELMNKKYPIINFFNQEQRNYSSIYGVLVNRKAFCIGISRTVKNILDLLRLENRFVWGYINSPQKGKIIYAWDMVKIKNNFYHPDATFDITRNPNLLKGIEDSSRLPSVKSTEFYSKNLLVSGDKILNSHLWNKKFYPSCKSSYPRHIIMDSIKNLRFQGIQFSYKQNY